MSQDQKPLCGAAAVVTGATRGIGKGIAIELGAAGGRAVYFTGRSTSEDPERPGTLAATAAEIEQGGGRAVPMRRTGGSFRRAELA